MTVAPAGGAAFAPTLTIRPPRMTITGFCMTLPLFGSIMRAARTTVVADASGGDGTCPRATAVPVTSPAMVTGTIERTKRRVMRSTVPPLQFVGWGLRSGECIGPRKDSRGVPLAFQGIEAAGAVPGAAYWRTRTCVYEKRLAPQSSALPQQPASRPR